MNLGKDLQVGDIALTDFNGPCRIAVMIVKRCDDGSEGYCESGIKFRVAPALKNGTLETWYDSGWFQKMPDYPAYTMKGI